MSVAAAQSGIARGVQSPICDAARLVQLRLGFAEPTEGTAEAGENEVVSGLSGDIRRTMATGLQKLGVRLEVTEAVLNHVSGSRAGIVGI